MRISWMSVKSVFDEEKTLVLKVGICAKIPAQKDLDCLIVVEFDPVTIKPKDGEVVSEVMQQNDWISDKYIINALNILEAEKGDKDIHLVLMIEEPAKTKEEKPKLLLRLMVRAKFHDLKPKANEEVVPIHLDLIPPKLDFESKVLLEIRKAQK